MGANPVREVLRHKCSRLRRIWADGAHAGTLVDWVHALRPHRPLHLEIVKRSDVAQGCEALRKRWIVERSLGWFNRDRRLSQDDAWLPATREAVIYVVMVHLMTRRRVCL